MIHVEVNSGIRAIHVYAADHFLKHGQGHAQQRMNVRFDNAVHIAETTSAGNIGSEYRNALFENLARNGPAYPHGLSLMRQTMARKNRGEAFAAVAIQQNGAAISRSDFKN